MKTTGRLGGDLCVEHRSFEHVEAMSLLRSEMY